MHDDESMRAIVNRLLRRSLRGESHGPVDLPVVHGRPLVDLTDVSAVLAAMDDADAVDTHLR
jgi:hypothetical protein